MKWVKTIAALLAGIVLVAIASLWIAGLGSNAGHYESVIEIGRPAAEVWPWITEPDKLKQWVSWLSEARKLTPEPTHPGSRAVWIMVDPSMGNRPIEIDSEVTSVVPNESLNMRVASSGMFSGTAAYTLTSLPGGGTRLQNAGDYRYEMWYSRLMEPLVRPEARKKLNADLLHLKMLVEGSGR
jgi:uncharacterized membrane protein